MISANDAVEFAAFTLLSAAPSIGAAVHQHVPEDTPPPVVIIGDMDAQPLATKGDRDRRVTLSVVTVTVAEERKPMLAIQGHIESRLDGAIMDVEGWSLTFSFVGDDAVLTPEGDGYVGNSNFTILALRA